MTFTAPEDGWYLIDPSVEGGARKVEPGGHGVEWYMDCSDAEVITFDNVPLSVKWRG